jgi:ankyrin repeat protein
MLLDMGADVTLADDEGRTALHWICTQAVPFDAACQKAFKALIAKDPSTLRMADKQGRLPLHYALEAFLCQSTSMDFAIRHLIVSGANPNIPDPVSGDSALHKIARSLAGDGAEEVAEAKALFKDLENSLDINAQNNSGESVVAAAIGSPYPETDHEYSRGYAAGAEYAYTKALHFLSGLGAKLDTTDAQGRNLLHIAAERHINHDRSNGSYMEEEMITELFTELLDMGVDPRKEDNKLRTPVDIAVARQFHSVVEMFSEEGKRTAEERKIE